MDRKKILITGSTGFIGKNLMLWIKNEFPQAKLYGTARTKGTDNGKIVIDLTQKELVNDLIKRIQPDYIFHLAGLLHGDNWDQFYDGNTKTAINILEAVKNNQLSAKVILLGSAAEYGHVTPENLPLTEENFIIPVSLYGLSKACQTNVAHYYSNQGVQVIVARLFNVFGVGISHQLSVGSFLYQIKKIVSGEAPPILNTGNLHSKRDYLYIDDVCSALMLLAEKGASGEVYNVCNGYSVSMDWMLNTMIRFAGVTVKIVNDPSKSKRIDVLDIYGSRRKIEGLGWRPCIGIEDGIAQMMRES